MKKLLTITLILIACLSSVFASDLLSYQTEHFLIYFEKQDQDYASVILGLCEEKYSGYTRVLGYETKAQNQVFIKSGLKNSYLDMSQSSCIYLSPQVGRDYAGDFSRLLAQSLVLGYSKSSILGDGYSKAAFNMPDFMARGIGYWLSSQSLGTTLIRQNKINGMAYGWESLDEDLLDCYGYNFIKYLDETYGSSYIYTYINNCRNGSLSRAKAFYNTYSLTLDEAFKAFMDSVIEDECIEAQSVKRIGGLKELRWIDSEPYALDDNSLRVFDSAFLNLYNQAQGLSVRKDGLYYCLNQRNSNNKLFCLYDENSNLVFTSAFIDQGCCLESVVAAFCLKADKLTLETYDYEGNFLDSYTVGPMGEGFWACEDPSGLWVKSGQMLYRLNQDFKVEKVYENNLDQFSYHDGKLYGSIDGHLGIMDTEDGQLSVSYNTTRSLIAYPSYHNGLIYFIGEGRLQKLDFSLFTFHEKTPKVLVEEKATMLQSLSSISVNAGPETMSFTIDKGVFTIALPSAITALSMEEALNRFASGNTGLLEQLGNTSVRTEEGLLTVTYDNEVSDEVGDMIIATLVQDLKLSFPEIGFSNLRFNGEGDNEQKEAPAIKQTEEAPAIKQTEEAPVPVEEVAVVEEPPAQEEVSLKVDEASKANLKARAVLVPFYKSPEKMLLGLGVRFENLIKSFEAQAYLGFNLQGLKPEAYASLSYRGQDHSFSLSELFVMGQSNSLCAAFSYYPLGKWYLRPSTLVLDTSLVYNLGFGSSDTQSLELNLNPHWNFSQGSLGLGAKAVFLPRLSILGGVEGNFRIESDNYGLGFALPVAMDFKAYMGKNASLLEASLEALVVGYRFPVDKDGWKSWKFKDIGLYLGLDFASSQNVYDSSSSLVDYYLELRTDASYSRFGLDKDFALKLKLSYESSFKVLFTVKGEF